MIDLFEKYEKIYNLNTKEYFKEVLSAYNNKNYRSAIVMLYSVLIYDIVSKLKELDSIYDQSWAKKILNEINLKRKENPKSPEWEKILLEKISNQNDFLSLSTIEEINHLKEIRNQCAHPVIDNNDELFMPSRYEADALINRILDEVLTIPAMFTGKITDYITEQIAKIVGYSEYRWDKQDELNKIFNAYFKRMNDKVFIKVFKDIWKLTFFVSNEDCDKNRMANVIFLDVMLNERQEALLESLSKDNTDYNKVSADPNINRYLSILIYRRNVLLHYMNDETKAYIKNSRETQQDVQLFAWFSFNSIEEYISNLCKINMIKSYTHYIVDIFKDSKFITYKDYFKEKLIEAYTNSSNFDNADLSFSLLEQLTEDFSKEDVLNMLEKSENNPQLTRRYNCILNDGRGKSLIDIIKNKGINFEDVDNFAHFKKFYKEFENKGTNDFSDIDDLPF